MKILTVTVTEFSPTLDGSVPSRETKQIGMFVDEGIPSAFEKVNRFLTSQKPRVPYLGHDMQVYPQFKVTVSEAK